MTPHYEILLEKKDDDVQTDKETLKDITDNLHSRLVSLNVVDSSDDKADVCKIVLNDRGNRLQTPPKKDRIKVSMGYKETGLVRMGDFFIDETGISGPPDTLYIQGNSADFQGGMKEQKNRNWEGKTLGEIVDTIASDVGFESLVQEELRSEYFERLYQDNETNNKFLLRVAKSIGAVYKPNGRRLVMVRQSSLHSQSGKPLQQVELNMGDLISWDLKMPNGPYYRSVRTWWYDRNTAEYYEVIETLKEDGESKKKGAGAVYTARGSFNDERTARIESKTLLDELQIMTKRLEIKTIGNPQLLSEIPVTITGGRSDLAKNWVIAKASHMLSHEGYTTTCTLTPYVSFQNN